MCKTHNMDSTALITQFYTAFQQLDAEAMAACYHKDVVFTDPAFGTLKGTHAANMWRMLCANQKDKGLKVEFSRITDHSAHWEAQYIFSKTERKVHNKIDATFAFKDGLIIEHTDQFNLHKWATQAMGIQGFLLGGTGFFRKKLQAQTNKLLARYESSL